MKARHFLAIAAAAIVLASCGNPQQKQQEEAATPLAEAAANEDLPKVYDDAADPVVQIDEAVAKAKKGE